MHYGEDLKYSSMLLQGRSRSIYQSHAAQPSARTQKISSLVGCTSPRKWVVFYSLENNTDSDRDTMKELFNESVDGLKGLVKEQVTFVNESALEREDAMSRDTVYFLTFGRKELIWTKAYFLPEASLRISIYRVKLEG